MSEKELAGQILSLVGGKDNITQVWHCATRLRMNLKNDSLVDINAISNLKGVVTAQFSGDQLQIIIGNKVNKVYQAVIDVTGEFSESHKKEEKNQNGIVSKIMETIAGIFTPILPVIAGTGLLKGFLSLAIGFNWLAADSSGYRVLYIVADGAFYFLPFLLAVSAAKMFKTNMFLSMAVASSLFYPTIVNGYAALSSENPAAPISLFGAISVPFLNYSSSVIPIILSIWLLSFVEPRVKKIVPNAISIMFSPMITLLIVIPLTLVVIGPLGNYIGQVLVIAISWLFEHAGLLAGALLGVGMPLIIMTGMHYALFPVVFNNFGLLGYDTMLNPIALVTNVAQAGAAFAVSIRTKNKDLKELAVSSGISAVLGITEPAMYGINIKLKKPFYACLIAGGISGAIVVFFGLKSFAFLTGIMSLPAYFDPNNKWNIVIAISGFILSFVLAFVLTLVFGFDDVENEVDTLTATDNQIVNEKIENNAIDIISEIQLHAPVKGKLINPETLQDKVFSTQIMGPSFVVAPENSSIYAPLSGEICYIPESKHAIGMKTNEELEVLIHIGIDTVELEGTGFEIEIAVGDLVKQGQLLARIDLEMINDKYDSSVITIVTNGQKLHTDLIKPFDSSIEANETIMTIS